jgi:hypothetical protein
MKPPLSEPNSLVFALWEWSIAIPTPPLRTQLPSFCTLGVVYKQSWIDWRKWYVKPTTGFEFEMIPGWVSCMWIHDELLTSRASSIIQLISLSIMTENEFLTPIPEEKPSCKPSRALQKEIQKENPYWKPNHILAKGKCQRRCSTQLDNSCDNVPIIWNPTTTSKSAQLCKYAMVYKAIRWRVIVTPPPNGGDVRWNRMKCE